MASAPTPLNPSIDYLTGLKNQLSSQLFRLDPKLASFNPPIPSQNEFDQALEPVARKAVNVGLGMAGLETLPAPMAVSGIVANLLDNFTKTPASSNPNTLGSPITGNPGEAGMSSLGLPALIEMAKRDTQRAFGGPDIHDIINARNELYHATGNYNINSILNKGIIKPGTGDQFEGVAMSRTPVIPEKTRQVRFAIDPSKIPPAIPTADSGYGKVHYTNLPLYSDVFKAMSDKDFKKAVEETKEKGLQLTPGINQYKLSFADQSQLADSPTFQKVFNKIKSEKGGGVPNPDYEFETRTKGQPISAAKAITKAIIGTNSGSSYDTDPMEVYSKLLQTKNPVPAILMQHSDVPLAKVLLNKELSQQVTGKLLNPKKPFTVNLNKPEQNIVDADFVPNSENSSKFEKQNDIVAPKQKEDDALTQHLQQEVLANQLNNVYHDMPWDEFKKAMMEAKEKKSTLFETPTFKKFYLSSKYNTFNNFKDK